MTTWYAAVCDDHMTYVVVTVTFTDGLASLDEAARAAASQFLQDHFQCSLRMVQGVGDFVPLDGYTDANP